MRKLLTVLSIGAFAMSAYAGNVDTKGSTDEANPLYLGSTGVAKEFTSSDSLLWKGIGSGSDADLPVDAYLYVDDNSTFTAQQIFVSGTNGDNANLNLIFGKDSSLTLTYGKPLSFNTSYSINMNLYTAKDVETGENVNATLTVNGLDFANANGLDKIAANGAKRNVSFGEGLTVTNKGDLAVVSAEGAGNFTVSGKLTNAKNATFTNANVHITKTGVVETAGNSYFGGNIVIDGSYIGAKAFNTAGNGANITVNGTLSTAEWFTGNDGVPLVVTVNDGGSFSVLNNNKLALYKGSSITANSGATVTSGELAVNAGASVNALTGSTLTSSKWNITAGKAATDTTDAIAGANVSIAGNATVSGEVVVGSDGTTVGGGSLVIEEGANVVVDGKVTVYEGASMTINGTFTNKKGEFLLSIDDDDSKTMSAPSFTLGSKAVLNVNSFRSRSAPVTFTAGSKVVIDATSYLQDGRGALILASNGNKIEEGAYVEVKGNSSKPAVTLYGSLDISGTFKVTGGSFIAANSGGIAFNSDDITLTDVNLALGNNGDLKTAKIEVQKNLDISGSALLVNKMSSDASSHTINISKDVTLNLASLGFYQQDALNKVTINLKSGSKIIFENLIFTGTCSGYNYGTLDDQDTIVINNFDENMIAVKNYNSVIDDAVLDRIIVNGVDELYWVKGENGYHWLSAIAPTVPEPAEWAMILGTLALGLAIYRKRK